MPRGVPSRRAPRARTWFLPLALWTVAAPSPARAQPTRLDYLGHLEQAAETGWAEYPSALQRWRRTVRPSELWGYDGPAQPVYLADLLGFLYQETGTRRYAERARDILRTYGELRSSYPEAQRAARVEYRDGIPAISNFFILPPYARAYMRIHASGALDGAARATIERDLAASLDHIFHFPEWGAHNRAMLRAESLFYGSVALPDHPHAARWRQMAATLASDSLHHWEIEDATGYHGVWLYSLFSFAEISGRDDVLRSVPVRYYLDYFVQLLTPHGNIADFGDAHWNGGWERFVPVYEKAAALYRDGRYKYVAQRLCQAGLERSRSGDGAVRIDVGVASALTDAYRWADDSVKAAAPVSRTQEVLEDIVGKKIVFRDGWDRASTMLLLNYRDEGDGGRLARDYLRQTIPVEEEKTHHGHADENGIALLMSGGSVLLHDGGYRPDLPSGPFGAYRADYFHNRLVVRKNKRDRAQGVYEFLRNSGAYRPVRTQKLDLLDFREVDSSRTRLIDADLGYEWDRTVTWVRPVDVFVVVDRVKALRDDYLTFTNLWHTRTILGREGTTFDTAYDRIQDEPLPRAKALAIHFPENARGKEIGTFPLARHFQDETAIYQTVSSHYRAGTGEHFVTVLAPHDAGQAARGAIEGIRLLEADRKDHGVALEIVRGGLRRVVCVRLDLDLGLARENVRPRHRPDAAMIRYGDLASDAAFLYARIGDGAIDYAAATMTRVDYRGRSLFRALPNTFGLQLDGAPPRAGEPLWRFWQERLPLGP